MTRAWGFTAALLLTVGGLAAAGSALGALIAIVTGRSDPQHGAGVIWALALAGVALVALPLGWLAARAARKPAA